MFPSLTNHRSPTVLRVPFSVFHVPGLRLGSAPLTNHRSATGTVPPHSAPRTPFSFFIFHFSLSVLRSPFRATTRDRPYIVFHSQGRSPVFRSPVSGLPLPCSVLRVPGLRLPRFNRGSHRALCHRTPYFIFPVFRLGRPQGIAPTPFFIARAVPPSPVSGLPSPFSVLRSPPD